MLAVLNIILRVVAVLMLGSCGLGTEIGNGVKPKNESPKDEASNDPQNKAETTSSQNSPAPTTESNTTTTTSTVTVFSNYDAQVIFAECGSPFSTVMLSPLQLEEMNAGLATGKKLQAVYLGESSTWRISTEGKVLYHINRHDNGKIELADSEKRVIPSGYTCENVVQHKEQNLNNGQRLVTQDVILLKNGRKINLSWSLLYGNNMVNPRLQKINVSTDSENPITYKAEILTSESISP